MGQMESLQTNTLSGAGARWPTPWAHALFLDRRNYKKRETSFPCLCRCNNLCCFTPHVERWTGLSHSASDRGTSPTSIHFPPSNFKHSLTLFSKSFSPFPHGTCLLSVSHPYLALDGIYHPFRVAFPNNPTHRQRLMVQQGLGPMGLSPS